MLANVNKSADVYGVREINTQPNPTMKEYQIDRACTLYNRATCPWTLRTDFSHSLMRIAARRARNWLEKHGRYGIDYKESDHSGRMIRL